MATCNDCLHVGVCYMVEHYGVDETEEGVEHDCRQFQDSRRPKGRWVKDKDGDEYCENCSRYMPCREVTGDPSATNYCPNCGAKLVE